MIYLISKYGRIYLGVGQMRKSALKITNVRKPNCGLLDITSDLDNLELSDPADIRMANFCIVLGDLLKIVKVLNENCNEDEYLEILYENIQSWITESREVLSQYDLEEEN